ncbi:MAG: hypothetical protein J1F35_03690 [Erysipelotrichales bacterium]|nr:hypothetical protein [Erysipelotrichales bacterium]
MQNLVNKEIDSWVRPWNIEQFNDLADRDERFFSLVIKGALGWLSRNIVLYNQPIKHFILNTGSTYLYTENNGYIYDDSETTGEDSLYMSLPRCVCEIESFQIQTDDLSSAFVRGTYERKSNKDGQIHGYNAEIRRIPIEISLKCHYILSNFNESIILIQELFDKLVFQKYFKIVYLGQVIPCSIEFPTSTQIEFDKIDMANPQDRTRKIDMELKLCTLYPQIDIRSELDNSTNVISEFGTEMNIYKDSTKNSTDRERRKYK